MSENKISYTNKDYNSILASLIEAIPQLTDKWKNFAEDDPGIVLLKLASFVGDMLCYNMDYQVRECFPQTATQRKHAASMYGLIGYKMHWYQSSVCNVNVKFQRPAITTGILTSSALILTIPNFTQIMSESDTPYVVIGSNLDRTLVLPVLADGQNISDNYVIAEMTAVQGVAYTQNNIFPSNITSDGRIYFRNTTVDEDTENNSSRPHMQLILCDGNTNIEIETWVKVDNLLNTREEGKYYEFKVDDNDAPYIQLCENYKNYLPLSDTKYFKLKYIISDGADGNVSENVGFTFQNIINIDYNTATINISEYVSILSNTQSDSGSNPETVSEARTSASREAQVLNTAVTLFDYETLVKSVDNVRACLAQDLTTANTTAHSIRVSKAQCYNETSEYIEYQLVSNSDAVLNRVSTGSLTISLLNVAGDPETVTVLDLYTDNGSSRILDSTPEIVSGSFVTYNNGTLSLNLVGYTDIANLTHVLFEYTTELTPYSIKLNAVVNDYQYITDYTRTSINSLLDQRKVVNIQYYLTEANIECIPYNIILHSTEPYTSSSSLLPYLTDVVYNSIYDFYDSEERTFGERINYAETVNLIQSSDSKVLVADIIYPERSYKVMDNYYPRLGQTAISLSDDPSTTFLQDNIFGDVNYGTLVTTLIGDSGFNVVIGSNTDKDNITTSLDLQTVVYINDTTGAVDLAGTARTVSWWCSRTDLVITEGVNIGNIITDNLSADTPITLFCKIYNGNSSFVIPISINLTLKV